MPRTELGPATCNCSRWNPADGHSPITKRDRLDARFINSISKPPRKGKQTIGPATGVARSNLEPGKSVFDDKPRFDRGRFRTRQSITHYSEYRGRTTYVRAADTSCGAAIAATWEDGNVANPSAKSTAKFGSTSFEYLNRRARSAVNLVAATVANAPPNLGRLFAAAIMKSKLFRPEKIERNDGRVFIRHTILVRHNGRLLRHVGRGWFGQNYPRRWDQAASCYLDVRIDGKATNSADLTWSQAAARMADEAVGNLSTRQYEASVPFSWWRCPLIFYEKPFLCIFLFWLMAGLDAPLSDFWLYAAEPPSREKKPRRYVPSNIYREGKAKLDREGKAKVGQQVSLKELLSVNTPRLAEYYRKCWRQVAATIKRPVAPTARDKAIASHWPLVAKKCRIVPKADRADAIQACMERLITVWEAWDPESGVPFGAFAAQAIDWEIQDFMKQLRRQVPVQRSINLNDPADNPADEDDDEKPPEPERPDMMKFNAMETQAAAARRRLVADRLGCLNLREQRVIEGRLALNGYKYPVGHEALAAELGMSERHIRRIESAAIEKLQQAVL